MKKAIAFLMVLCMLLGVSALAESDTLVVYFSCTGTTKGVAEKLANVTGADLYEIVPAVPYTAEDLNYNDRSTRATSEQDHPDTRPEIGGEDIDKFEGDMRLTIAEGGEDFVTYGSEGKSEPPSEGEVIYRDDFGAVCRCWNWREAERTMLTEDTVNAFMIIEAHNADSAVNMDAALDELKD